jgi:hypothetical protein
MNAQWPALIAAILQHCLVRESLNARTWLILLRLCVISQSIAVVLLAAHTFRALFLLTFHPSARGNGRLHLLTGKALSIVTAQAYGCPENRGIPSTLSNA